jgi:hypothetical protein
MRRILGSIVLVAGFLMFPVGSANAGPCGPERPCPPCPLVITFDGIKPRIESAQC